MATTINSNSTYENDHEKYCRWYLEDLQENGFIKKIEREAETFLVLPSVNVKREKHFVRKDNEYESIELLSSLTYTYDFRIIWDPNALSVFTEVLMENSAFRFGDPLFISQLIEIDGVQEIVSYIDVKPHSSAAQHGGNLSTFYTFPVIQKVMYSVHNLYINKIVPVPNGKKYGATTCLFAKSFTPKRYFFTNKSMTQRTMHHKPIKTFSTYLEQRLAVIDKLLKQEQSKSSKKTQGKLNL
jgi:hypothetical protein